MTTQDAKIRKMIAGEKANIRLFKASKTQKVVYFMEAKIRINQIMLENTLCILQELKKNRSA